MNKKIILLVLTILFLLPCFIHPVSAQTENTYYVATTGSDNNSGTQSSPWKTIQKAADTMVAGDTVLVNSGTYNERIAVTRSGTSDALITFKANGAVNINDTFNIYGSYVKLEGFTIGTTRAVWTGTIYIEGDYCVVESCTVQDTNSPGIVLKNLASHATVKNNTVKNAKVTGIDIDGTDNLIINNDISHTKYNTSLSTEANGMNTDSDVAGSSSGHKIIGNYIHDILFSEQDGYSPHIDAIQNNGPYIANNITVERNHIYLWQEALSGSTSSTGFMLSLADNWTIKNNIIETWAGVNTGNDGPNSNMKFYNNVFISNIGWTNHYWGSGINLNGGTNNVAYNNILVNFRNADRGAHMMQNYPSQNGGFTGDYNLFWQSDGTPTTFLGYTKGVHDMVNVDPKFIANYTNLHLHSNSPAKDAGFTIDSVTDDYDGTVRPQGDGFDIGAYEFMAIAASPSPSVFPSSSTNPADINKDGTVNALDLELVFMNWLGIGSCNAFTCDLNSDSKINAFDAAFVISHWSL